MQEIISCPSCKRKLQVPEGLIGQDVQCPTCGATFTARVGGKPSGGRPAADRPQPRWEDDRDRYDDDEDRGYESRRNRRDLAPHRGSAVLTLGILSIVGSLICPPTGAILGPIAWTMGQADMAEIHAGRMDPDGESATSAGRVTGIIGTFLGGLITLFCGLFTLASIMTGA